MATWLLIHSPLVDAATWAPVAARLRKRGHEAVIPDLSPALSDGGSHVSRQAELAAAAVGHGPVYLVAHSAAGPLLPLIAHQLGMQDIAVLASVFVDAALPHPGQSALDVLPAAAVQHLHDMTVEGWLPPWTSWWSPEQLGAMLPDEQLRNALIEACPPLPESLFTEVLPNVGEHELGTCCYIRLSSNYEPFAAAAGKAGWPVRHLTGHHLAILTTPGAVADVLHHIVGTA
ncbi:hypothetical protein [Arthrobacter sp. ISL-28]|uniref:hypothetical protein n=1 Tax=Arthrobacter sp. ISL-28 TaxID=2819108 RepID=UPI001BEB022B|nr:hypothetical protein [Arthrobacter sp. ISL-28]MBT2520022.1 hypothetical protein [Arthrobacter sp. ISL-28]